MSKIDLNAPIIPWEGLGGIKLYTHIRDLQDIIMSYKDGQSTGNGFTVSCTEYKLIYEKKGVISFIFNIINGKLYSLDAQKGYSGKIFGKIHTGMSINEVLKIESSLIYDDFEELYISKKYGIVIETDHNDCVNSISIQIKECGFDDLSIGNSFDRGEW